MDFENKPVLCGSLFFFLMTLDKASKKKRCYANGENAEGITEPEMLLSWIDITKDNQEINRHDSIDTAISKYKNCTVDSISNCRFDSSLFIDEMTNSLANKAAILKKIQTFLSTFLVSENAAVLFCKRIVSILLDDETIPEETEFYLDLDFNKIKKSEIRKRSEICVEAALYGIWYYIITNKIKNTDALSNFMKIIIPSGVNRTIKQFNEGEYSFNPDLPKNFVLLDKAGIVILDEDEDYDTDEQAEAIKEAESEVIKYSPYGKYAKYVAGVTDYNKTIKTILNPMANKDFYDFFISPSVCKKESGKDDVVLHSPTPKTLTDTFGHYMCLMANPGLGKSMLLKHMLLCDSRWDGKYGIVHSRLVPLLLKVTNYHSGVKNLLDLFFEQIQKFDNTIKKEEFIDDLKNGQFLFLLDALDELNLKASMDLINELNDFCARYKDNYFLLSSRIDEVSAGMLKKFTTLSLLPFNKARAEKLITKFKNFDEFDDAMCDTFITKLKSARMTSIESNPLLLTIKFMVYAHKNEFIGGETYRFYKSAFETLFETHDHLENNFIRTYKTKLNFQEMEELLCEFCYKTFIYRWYYFTEDEFYEIFDDLEAAQKYHVRVEDFIFDMTKNLNLFIVSDGYYAFIHRSFQEYFTAKHMSRQPASFFTEELIDIIDSCKYFKGKAIDDENQNKYVFFDLEAFYPVLDMLAEMSEKRLWKYILAPKLNSVLPRENDSMAVLKYLSKAYAISLEWSTGEVPGGEECAPICPLQIVNYLLERLLGENMYHMDFMPDVDDDRFIKKKFIRGGWDEETNEPTYIDCDYVDFGDLPEDEWPPVCGKVYKVNPENLVNDPQWNEPMTSAMVEEFISDFEALYKFRQKMERRHN